MAEMLLTATSQMAVKGQLGVCHCDNGVCGVAETAATYGPEASATSAAAVAAAAATATQVEVIRAKTAAATAATETSKQQPSAFPQGFPLY